MTAIVLSVLGLAVVFASFGVLTAGHETGRCGLCAGERLNNNLTNSECDADLSREKTCGKRKCGRGSTLAFAHLSMSGQQASAYAA